MTTTPAIAVDDTVRINRPGHTLHRRTAHVAGIDSPTSITVTVATRYGRYSSVAVASFRPDELDFVRAGNAEMDSINNVFAWLDARASR